MAEQQSHSLFVDGLYCEEEKWVDEEDEDEEEELEHDTPYEDQELALLFVKEQEQHRSGALDKDLSNARGRAVDWMLKVIARFGFSALTGILGLNYLDRFLVSFCYQKDKPWMIQIAAVACLSLAAKVEETQVPLLLELQEVVESEYMFKAKDIQSMELLVLSTLNWKMHPVTPISFVDYIVRRLGSITHLPCEFLGRCERLLLSLLSDSRSVVYLPSVLATATMMHVIDKVEPFHSLEYRSHLLGVLDMTQDDVNGCYLLIQEQLPVMRTTTGNSQPRCMSHENDRSYLKRKYDQQMAATGRSRRRRSPSGVIDAAAVLGCDSSNDSWTLGGDIGDGVVIVGGGGSSEPGEPKNGKNLGSSSSSFFKTSVPISSSSSS